MAGQENTGRESPKRKADTDVDAERESPLLFNLMPHDFHLYDEDGKIVTTVPKNGFVLRTENAHEPARCEITFGGITMMSDEDVPQLLREGDAEKLAEFKGHAIVVSRVAAEALMQHAEKLVNPIGIYVITPNSAPDSVVRDEKGGIAGVKRVLRWGYV